MLSKRYGDSFFNIEVPAATCDCFLPYKGVSYRGRQAGGPIRPGGDAAQPGGQGGPAQEAEAAEGLAVARARPDDDHLVALAQEELVGIVGI